MSNTNKYGVFQNSRKYYKFEFGQLEVEGTGKKVQVI